VQPLLAIYWWGVGGGGGKEQEQERGAGGQAAELLTRLPSGAPSPAPRLARSPPSPPRPARSLWECGGGMVADGRLLDLIRRIYCFGMSLLKLDLRQESTRHADALDTITTYLGYGR
jgi:hypothetical protein